MSEQIEQWMDLYKTSPSLVLFEDMIDVDSEEEKQEFLKLIPPNETLNPIDVVLESLVNIISEKISSETITESEDKILINPIIRKKAVAVILDFLGRDYKKVKMLHELWLKELLRFLRHLYKNTARMQIEEVLFQISKRFRISGISAIKTVSTIMKT